MDNRQLPAVILPPQDTKQAALLQEELARRQLQLALQLHQTALTVEAEKQLHQHVRQELETYAQELEAWLNQPGRSPEQQEYVKALAAELRDTFTRNVLTRMQLTTAQLTDMVARDVALPEPPQPVIEVVPQRPPWVRRHQAFTWFLLWLASIFLLPSFFLSDNFGVLWVLALPVGLVYFTIRDRRNRYE